MVIFFLPKDFKCNLREVIEVHISRNLQFCFMKNYIHSLIIKVCSEINLISLVLLEIIRPRQTIRILSLKTGLFDVSITFLVFCAFRNGLNNIFVLSVRSIKHLLISFTLKRAIKW